MISKNKQKIVRSLALKKKRDELNMFVAEGRKVVSDLFRAGFSCAFLAGTKEFLAANPLFKADEINEVTEAELQQTSLLKSPQQVLAIFRKPTTVVTDLSELPQKTICLALDCIQDSGNLGTIIRLADWFGVEHIICSLDTADAFSPKTVQATMGSIGRVHLIYTSLKDYISNLSPTIPIYGTFLEGDNIYEMPLEQHGLIVMGNEGNGISSEIEACITQKLLIPKFSQSKDGGAESLNVGTATAITLSEFKRRKP